MPWPWMPLRAVTITGAATPPLAGSRPRCSRRGWRWRGGPSSPGWRPSTPASARAARTAAEGPSAEGVMMWSASEVTPTARGSMPRGSKPRARMCSHVADDPDRRASRHVGAPQLGEGLRHLAVGGDHPGAVEAADGQGVGRRVGGAHHHRLGLAGADGVHGELQGEAEGGAGGHRGEGHAVDLPQHGDLGGGDVGDVPDHVRRHRPPGGLRRLPLLLQPGVAAPLLLHDRHLGGLHAALDLQALDLPLLRQVLPEAVGALGPEVPPRLLVGLAVDLLRRAVGGGVGVQGQGAGRGAQLRLPLLLALVGQRLVLGPGAVALRARPEAVPAPLRAVQGHALLVDRRQAPEAGADVDVGLGVQVLERLLEPRVLPQGLDERRRSRTGSTGPSSRRAGGSGWGGTARRSTPCRPRSRTSGCRPGRCRVRSR